MASHQELVDELPKVNSMGTEQRLRYAQQRRAEQMKKWRDYEIRLNNLNGVENQKKNDRHIKFGDCITLLEAAARNDYEEVKSLLSENVNPNETNEDGLTALHQACIDNFEEIVLLLLDYKADVNAVDSEFWTPLHAACTCGHTKIAQILVQGGANLLALNADQNMPYDICEEESTLQFIEDVMSKKGITQEQINEVRATRENQIIDEVQIFLDSGGDIDTRDKVGATLLHVAAANGYIDLTRFFLLHSNKVNAQDNDGWTPLHAASCWCQLEIVELLGVQSNADPTIKNKLGETAIDVTEDAEVKVLLQKLVKTFKERKKPKMLIGFRRRHGGNGSRVSGIRGQSFKGRSKRDKKKGISAVEAKSESAFWHKGQETSIFNKDEDDDTSSHSSHKHRSMLVEGDVISAAEKDRKWPALHNDSLKSKQSNGGANLLHLNGDTGVYDLPSKNNSVSKFNLAKSNEGSFNDGETLNELKRRRSNSQNEAFRKSSELSSPEKLELYHRLNGTTGGRSCSIL